MTDLSIVVVTWNTRELAERCLSAVWREVVACRPRLACELIVVDNGSRDGTPDAVSERFPEARLLRLPRNRGFAVGANRGLAVARARFALLLNSDAFPLPGALERAVAYLDAHPDVGVVGASLLRPDGRRRTSGHRYPRLVSELVPPGLLAVALPRRFPSWRTLGGGPADVEAVRGAALFLRRGLLGRVGALPEHYFFFLEETEWCWKVRAAGLRVVELPGVRAVHLSGASSARSHPSLTRIEYHRSLYRFLLRRRGAGRAALVWALRVAKGLARVVLGAPLALARPGLRSRWRVHRDVLAWHLRGCPAGVGLSGIAGDAP